MYTVPKHFSTHYKIVVIDNIVAIVLLSNFNCYEILFALFWENGEKRTMRKKERKRSRMQLLTIVVGYLWVVVVGIYDEG